MHVKICTYQVILLDDQINYLNHYLLLVFYCLVLNGHLLNLNWTYEHQNIFQKEYLIPVKLQKCILLIFKGNTFEKH